MDRSLTCLDLRGHGLLPHRCDQVEEVSQQCDLLPRQLGLDRHAQRCRNVRGRKFLERARIGQSAFAGRQVQVPWNTHAHESQLRQTGLQQQETHHGLHETGLLQGRS